MEDDVKYIEMSTKTASRVMPDFKFSDGMFFTANELEEKRMASCASTGILINDTVECDYLVILTDGSTEEGYF